MRKNLRTATTLAIATFLGLSSFATNYINTGSGTTYNLSSGDTLRITSGTYQGNINSFVNGAVIIVSSTATFKPNYVASPAGKIINYGVCQGASMATYGGFALVNNGVLNITGDVSLYDGNRQTWVNNVNAAINIGGSFAMNNAEFTNWANVYIGGNMSLYLSTSTLTNAGTISITGNFNMSNGTFTNLDRISMREFNGWGGTINNQGEISPKGNMVFPANSSHTNNCLLVAQQDFTNYGNFTNNGLLWIGKSNATFTNGNDATFSNASNAAVRTTDFTNWGTIKGAGNYYITGTSTTGGTVGQSGLTSNVIKVYDVTRSSATRIFDNQWGTVYTNVTYAAFAEPDTNNLAAYTGCSSYFRSSTAILLPIVWKAFDAKLVQNTPVISWSAEGDATQYEVERSYDNVNFTSAATISANASKAYSITDASARRNTTVYYRVKAIAGNQQGRYTETKMLKTESTTAATITVYPNPVKNSASISFTAQNNNVTIVVKNVSGQPVITKSATVVKGANSINLTEVATLSAGVYFMQVVDGNTITSESFVKN